MASISSRNEKEKRITAELSRHIITFATNRDLISCFSRKQTITPAHLERGADIYIQIPEHLLEQWRPLLTLIVNQFLSFFERRSEQNDTPILFLLDEFPRLGKIPTILNGLATLRSKKITICLLIQSLAQLDLIYGEHSRKVISDNCAYKPIFGATDADTQEYFSKLVGTYDKIKDTESEYRKPYIPVTQGSSTSTTTEDKRIIRPEEFATLRDIVLLTPFGFCRVNKAPYWENNHDSADTGNAQGYDTLSDTQTINESFATFDGEVVPNNAIELSSDVNDTLPILTNDGGGQDPVRYDIGIATEVYQPTPQSYPATSKFDGKAFTKLYGKNLRIRAVVFGILALLFSTTVGLGIVFGLFAILFACIAKLVVRHHCPKENRKSLKKCGRAGIVLGGLAIRISIAWLIVLIVIFTFFADFTVTINNITDLLGFRLMPELLAPIQSFFEMLKGLFGL